MVYNSITFQVIIGSICINASTTMIHIPNCFLKAALNLTLVNVLCMFSGIWSHNFTPREKELFRIFSILRRWDLNFTFFLLRR